MVEKFCIKAVASVRSSYAAGIVPQTLDIENSSMLLDLSTIDPQDSIFPSIQEDVQRILDCYHTQQEIPPPIEDMLQFIHNQDYEDLLEHMFVLWRKISKYHNETQSKSPPIVMPTFNKIHAKLRSHFSNSDNTE